MMKRNDFADVEQADEVCEPDNASRQDLPLAIANIAISPESPVPIYEQIVAQVVYGVAAGVLEVGSFIPSVRELAEQLLVHPNTVARAWEYWLTRLEKRGALPPRARAAPARKPTGARKAGAKTRKKGRRR